MLDDKLAKLDDKLAKLDASVVDVEVSETFKSPAGDKATDFLDKQFTQLEEYLKIKLPDSFYKQFLLLQLQGLYAVLRSFVVKQLN